MDIIKEANDIVNNKWETLSKQSDFAYRYINSALEGMVSVAMAMNLPMEIVEHIGYKSVSTIILQLKKQNI